MDSKPNLKVRVLSYAVTGIIVLLLSPFWLTLLIVNLVESPRKTVRLLFNKESWRPFGREVKKC